MNDPAIIISGDMMLFILTQEDIIALMDYVGVEVFKFADTFAQYITVYI